MCAEPVMAMQPDTHKPKWREAVRERWRTTLLYVWERNGTPHPYAAQPHTARRKACAGARPALAAHGATKPAHAV
ncbi:hypothetical protein AA11825_1051 [Acetobacter pomorum DSM 11825]|nr:hypothetical protein [Acetobacter pomorum]KDE19389.1 hypothetical protein AZ09_12960 [Acetobacter aceti 1023]GBR48608.1 hypothetical protein AA11825_1051 [Acetobacter pomorum DSM 11825]